MEFDYTYREGVFVVGLTFLIKMNRSSSDISLRKDREVFVIIIHLK